MRRLILLLLALLPSVVWAQCAPAEVKGSGTPAVLEPNAAGVAVAWWCPGTFTPTLALYAVRWDALTDPMRSQLSALPGATSPAAAIEQMRIAHATTPLSDDALRAIWEPARARILASRPADTVWLVARNGTTLTRPSYPVTDGVRSTIASAVRATVDMTCGCMRLRVVEGTSTYCAFDGASALVALCTRAQ